MITPLAGDDLNVPRDDNHLIFEWNKDGSRVVFSVTEVGDSLNCHYAAEKHSLRKMKEAVVDMEAWLFDQYKWCKMITAYVLLPSVGRMLKKLGYFAFGQNDKGVVYYIKTRGQHGRHT